MAAQVEVPKLVQTVAIGPASSTVAVPKLTMLVLLQPGEGEDTSNRQGHIHTRVIRRS